MSDPKPEAGVGTPERIHELKTWPDYYTHLVDGSKTFEYRRNDRGFRVGDLLHLREWEPQWEPLAYQAGEPTCGRYTGREMRRRVTYVLATSPEFVVMGLAQLDASATRIAQLEAARDALVAGYAQVEAKLRAAEAQVEALRKILARILQQLQYDPVTRTYRVTETTWFAQPYTFKNPSDWLKAELASPVLAGAAERDTDVKR